MRDCKECGGKGMTESRFCVSCANAVDKLVRVCQPHTPGMAGVCIRCGALKTDRGGWEPPLVLDLSRVEFEETLEKLTVVKFTRPLAFAALLAYRAKRRLERWLLED